MSFIFKAVTGRPGARFGPGGIRQGSSRMRPEAAWSVYTRKNNFLSWAKILDCGDVLMTSLDNTVALKQLGKAHKVCLLTYKIFLARMSTIALDGRFDNSI